MCVYIGIWVRAYLCMRLCVCALYKAKKYCKKEKRNEGIRMKDRKKDGNWRRHDERRVMYLSVSGGPISLSVHLVSRHVMLWERSKDQRDDRTHTHTHVSPTWFSQLVNEWISWPVLHHCLMKYLSLWLICYQLLRSEMWRRWQSTCPTFRKQFKPQDI